MKRFETVEEFIENEKRWKKEITALRGIIGETELVETVKWGGPVYTLGGKNVVGLGSFKSYFGIWFFQGVFLKDRAGKLVNAGEGTTKALRQWRFNSADEIDRNLILEYLGEAIENQRAGMEVKPEAKKAPEIPPELSDKFKEDAALKQAFDNFTAFKQREFAEFIRDAKRDETKQKRLEKIIPMILEGVGLHDKYRS